MTETSQLLSKLAYATEQCKSKYNECNELATETDPNVRIVLSYWEEVFEHNLKCPTGQSILRHKQIIVNKVSNSVFDDDQLMPTYSESGFFPVIRQLLTASELNRFETLSEIHTDYGRAKAWLRASLNEQSFERYVRFLVESDAILNRFYSENAVMRDLQKSILPNLANDLSGIIFALVVDDARLDQRYGLLTIVEPANGGSAKAAVAINRVRQKRPDDDLHPVLSFDGSGPSLLQPAAKKLPKPKVVSFDSSSSLSDDDDQSGDIKFTAAGASQSLMHFSNNAQSHFQSFSDLWLAVAASGKAARDDAPLKAKDDLPSSDRPVFAIGGRLSHNDHPVKGASTDNQLIGAAETDLPELDSAMVNLTTSSTVLRPVAASAGLTLTPVIAGAAKNGTGDRLRQRMPSSSSISAKSLDTALDVPYSRLPVPPSCNTLRSGGSAELMLDAALQTLPAQVPLPLNSLAEKMLASHDDHFNLEIDRLKQDLQYANERLLLERASHEEQIGLLKQQICLLERDMMRPSESGHTAGLAKAAEESVPLQPYERAIDLDHTELSGQVGRTEVVASRAMAPADSIDVHYEAAQLEQKLVEMAQQHGEMVEFCDQLQRIIATKDKQLVHLQTTLQQYQAMASVRQSSSLPITLPITGANSNGLVTCPIQVWIPSAFRQQQPGHEPFYVYQLFLQARGDEDWTIYRRYREFKQLHLEVRRKFAQIWMAAYAANQLFPFPGRGRGVFKLRRTNSSLELVEQRRKKLEQYVRRLVNVLYVGGAMPDLLRPAAPDKDGRLRSAKRALANVHPFFQSNT